MYLRIQFIDVNHQSSVWFTGYVIGSGISTVKNGSLVFFCKNYSLSGSNSFLAISHGDTEEGKKTAFVYEVSTFGS